MARLNCASFERCFFILSVRTHFPSQARFVMAHDTLLRCWLEALRVSVAFTNSTQTSFILEQGLRTTAWIWDSVTRLPPIAESSPEQGIGVGKNYVLR